MKSLRNNILLAAVFILILPVFTWLRWDPAPWFRAQLKSSGVSSYVQVEKIAKSGLGLYLKQVRIHIPGRPDISLNGIRLSPAWFRIIRRVPALHVQGDAGSAELSFDVSMRDGAIGLHGMDIRAAAGIIKDYLPQAVMLNLGGSLLISGDIKLRRRDGLPLTGTMIFQWQNAASGLLGQDPLGDFRLQLTSSKESEWRWQIEGGEMLSLKGKGRLSTTSRNPAFWKMDGNVHVQSRGGTAAMLSGVTGHNQGNLVLSGNLSQPHMAFMQ